MRLDDVEAGAVEGAAAQYLLARDSDSTPAPRSGSPRATGALAAVGTESTDLSRLAWGPVPEDAPLDRDAEERALLVAIAAGDDGARGDYADWLELRSEHARATYLRVEQLVHRLPPGDVRLEGCTRQLREVAPYIGPDWRARVARIEVEGCLPRAGCTARWELLERTDRETVRYCTACCRHVYYFASADDARALARRGHCVAVDRGAERWQSDLVLEGVSCACCGRRVGAHAPRCPHCGQGVHGGMVIAGLVQLDL
jgi:uncharacterized protein (TIGR02996 family)